MEIFKDNSVIFGCMSIPYDKILEAADKIKKTQMTDFKNLLADYKDAVAQDAWKGGGHPDDIPGVEARVSETEAALINYVRGLL